VGSIARRYVVERLAARFAARHRERVLTRHRALAR